jgi:hypothetical protein
MPNALGWATLYGELADECLKLSELASDEDIREHFSKIAANYLVMARAELTRAEQERGGDQSQQ